jgi:hypothetical protein
MELENGREFMRTIRKCITVYNASFLLDLYMTYRVIKTSLHLMITVQKNILNSFNHHDNVVRIRCNRWH